MVETLKSSDQDDLVPGFGAMGLSSALGRSLSYEEAEPVLLKALEFGCTFWDTAVSHANGVNEKLLGDFIRKHDCRDRVFLASKCGVAVFEDEAINSASHIQTHIDGTIDRLGFAPDLYYLHRIDRSTTLQESISALDSIRKADKTKYIGLSECSAATLREADSIAKIDAFLAEYSAFETFHKHDDGLVDTCRELNVAFQLTAPWVTVGWSTSTTSPTNHQVTPNKMSTEDRSPSP